MRNQIPNKLLGKLKLRIPRRRPRPNNTIKAATAQTTHRKLKSHFRSDVRKPTNGARYSNTQLLEQVADDFGVPSDVGLGGHVATQSREFRQRTGPVDLIRYRARRVAFPIAAPWVTATPPRRARRTGGIVPYQRVSI